MNFELPFPHENRPLAACRVRLLVRPLLLATATGEPSTGTTRHRAAPPAGCLQASVVVVRLRGCTQEPELSVLAVLLFVRIRP